MNPMEKEGEVAFSIVVVVGHHDLLREAGNDLVLDNATNCIAEIKKAGVLRDAFQS